VVEDVLGNELASNVDGSSHDVHVDQRSVLAGALGDEVLRGSTHGATVDLLPLGAQVRSPRHEVVDVLADGLRRRVAEQPLGRRIPGRDNVVQVRGDDRLRTHFEESLEESSLAVELGDVVVDGERPDRLAVHDQGSGQQLDVNDAPILPGTPADGLDVLAGRYALPELHGFGVESVRTGYEIIQVPSRSFLRRVPEESLRGRVPRRDPVVEVGEHDSRRTDLEDLLETPRQLEKLMLDLSASRSRLALAWRTHGPSLVPFSAARNGVV
jgi:hypothetical protein